MAEDVSKTVDNDEIFTLKPKKFDAVWKDARSLIGEKESMAIEEQTIPLKDLV